MRKTMQSLSSVAVVLVLLAALTVAPHATASAGMDGSTPLVCSVTSMLECDGSGQCERQNPARHPDYPSVLRINVPGRIITGAAPDGRKTEIKSVSRLDGHLVLNGSENGRGWAASIAEDSGRMAAGIVADDFTLNLFGACTAP